MVKRYRTKLKREGEGSGVLSGCHRNVFQHVSDTCMCRKRSSSAGDARKTRREAAPDLEAQGAHWESEGEAQISLSTWQKDVAERAGVGLRVTGQGSEVKVTSICRRPRNCGPESWMDCLGEPRSRSA